MRFDDEASWASINANHMLPSGSSLFHPHMQGSVDPVPSTLQEQLARVPGERFHDYLETERRLGERYLGRLGCAEWLTSFLMHSGTTTSSPTVWPTDCRPFFSTTTAC